MTLNTEVYLHEDIDPHEVFSYCRGLLGADRKHVYDDEAGIHDKTARTVSNRPDQGLPAWLMLHYRHGGPLRANEDACTEDCEPEDDYHYHPVDCWIEVEFDTAYGYKDEQGRGCGDLHACYVAQFGQWLDERGIPWSWKNEFTGEVFAGEDRYRALTELTGQAADATAWFMNTVAPAIGMEVGR